MSTPVTTAGPTVSSVRWVTKRGARFTRTVNLPALDGVDWSAATGTAQLRDADGNLIHDFGTVTASVATDGSANIVFDAPSSATLAWQSGVYWWDAFWQSGTDYGPTPTETYRVDVAGGPTNL